MAAAGTTPGGSLADLSKWPLLQNKIKRDPGGYVEEFERALLHFRSSLDLFRLKPSSDDKELPSLLSFVSNVAPCYAEREDVRSLGAELMAVLDAHADALVPAIRLSFVQALILLRNRGLAPPVEVLSLFFRLFRCRDRSLRKYLHDHIVGDVKNVNLKRKNQPLNRALQNFMYSMVSDENGAAARHSLDVMVELYRKQVWNDAKTVNVIATAAFHASGHMVAVALRFLLGRDLDDAAAGDDDDDDDDGGAAGAGAAEVRHQRMRTLTEARKLAGNSQTGRAGKKQRKLKRAAKAAGKHSAARGGAAPGGQFSPIMLLNDPQGFADRLFGVLRSSTARFELRLLMMSTLSQLIASHQLLLLNYYPWLQKYVQPHQAQVSLILANAAQACHELVPPDALESLVRAIVHHFVSDRSRPEVIAIGLNTLREICARVPAVMDETLLHDLVQYKKDRDKNVVAAARSLIVVFREKYPELLHRRDRGKTMSLQLAAGSAEAKPAAYGAVRTATGVAGVELLAEHQRKNGDVDVDSEEEAEAEAEEEEEEEEEEEASEEIDAALADEAAGADGAADDSDASEEDEEHALDGSDDDDDSGDLDDGGGSAGFGTDEEEDSEGGSGEEDEHDEGGGGEQRGAQRDAKPAGAAKRRRGAAEQREDGAADGAGPAGPRLDVSRILTDADFERLRKLRELHAKQQLQSGQKRKRVDDDAAHEAAVLAEQFAIVNEEAINPLDIEGAKARKRASKAERLESVHAGRTDRERFGHKRKKSSTGGLTNVEKKKMKNYNMDRYSRNVRVKNKASARDKQIAVKKRAGKMKNKRCGRR